MPNKRSSLNAYFFFALDMIPELRRRGFQVSGVKEAIPLCSEDWALLSPDEKERYSEKAKARRSREANTDDGSSYQEKEQKSNAQVGGELRGQDWFGKRCDGSFQHQSGHHVSARGSDWLLQSHGQCSASPQVLSRRDQGAGDAVMQKSLVDLDKCEIFIMNVYSHGEMPLMCEQRYVPCEIGCVRYSLQNGIMSSFHDFIDPGDLPFGFRYHCQAGSASTHQIPVSGFELANRDYHNLFRALCDFVFPTAKRWTSVYCKNNDVPRVKWCLQWLAKKAGIENHFQLQDIESLIIKFYRDKLNEEPSKSSVHRLLDVVKWDYANDTRCKWHEDNDMWECALASCKKVTYCMSRALASVYDVVITSAHLPNLLTNDKQKSENGTIVVLDAKRYQMKMNQQHRSDNGSLMGAVGGDSSLGMRGVDPINTSKARGRGILRLLAEMPVPYANTG